MTQPSQQPPLDDEPIPFFGGANTGLSTGPSAPRQPIQPLRPQPQQGPVRPPIQQQRTGNTIAPVQLQPQRHPQQHAHPIPQQGYGLQQVQQPSRQMNQSPFASAADLFTSSPGSQQQGPLQGYQSQAQPQRFPPSNQLPPPVQQQQHQQQASSHQRQQSLPYQQQQQASSQSQRNPQQQQEQFSAQGTVLPAVAPVPPQEQSYSPFASASDLFGNSISQATGWSISSATEDAVTYGHPTMVPSPLQKQPSQPLMSQSQETPLAPPPPLQHSIQSSQQQQQYQGPPQGPSPIAPSPHMYASAPVQTDQTTQKQPSACLPPPPRAAISTPRQGASLPSSSQQDTSPYANHLPPKTPILTAIQTPLMLPAQTPQALQSSHTPYIGPVRNQYDSSSPQILLKPCPYTDCGGENKPYSKFCSECGRSISTTSHPATPALGRTELPVSSVPPMPNLDRINAFSQEYQQNDLYINKTQDDQAQQQYGLDYDQSRDQEYEQAHDQQDYSQQGHDQQGYGQQNYGQQSYDQQNYDQNYDQQNYDQQNYDQQSHEQQSHEQQNYDQQNYEQQNYDQQNYEQQNYDQQGYNQQSYEQQGYNPQCYDPQSYDPQSFDSQSYDPQSYDPQSYSQQNYEQGYQQQEYDQTYSQTYGDTAYYDQNQQGFYDPTTSQYIDQYQQQEQAMPEPEPMPEELEGVDDPLNRIHGCPIIAFGFGGKIMVSFPRLVQRFDSASNTMITKKYPGDLQLKHVKEVLSVDKDIATYPGPLLVDNAAQMKNKRKDVLKFIEHKINGLEHGQQDDAFDAHRVLIWRLFKVMFEQEGALVGGPKIDEAVRSVLLSIPLTMYPAESFHEHTGPVRTSASLDKLQDLLRRGDRAGAVRYAMNANLWAHALVISSSVNKELWKEAVNGFVNQELMAGGGEQQANGREAMRVLYALFSGQTQSAINEIIPMGLRNPPEDTQNGSQVQEEQFVTAESLSFVKPIEEPKIPGTSLGQWRDTLAMILSNRTAGDQSAICSLGDLLMKEGWVEAAHICYLLSPQVSLHSGLDAPSNRLVLIGADQSPYAAFPFYKNITAFQKTEIYEFACALKSPGVASALPFLQPYKLHYVWTLVELGMFSEAGRYLESIEAIVKSQTKGSPYYNVVFLERLKDITERLTGSSQLTVTEESWFTKKVPKPTIGGIFDALDSKISKFIAGDNDQPKPVIVEPKANSVESGPFANAPALPDLSNIPPRALSRSSNGARATNQDSAIDRSRRPSGSKLEVPKANIYGQGQPTTTYANPIQASGYDQNDEYGLQTYPQTDANTAYGYHSQGYNNDPNQTFEESYQEGGETSDYRGYSQQAQPQEQQMFTNSGGQLAQSGYDTNYNTGYNSQYDNQYAGQGDFTNESVATQAAQTDATFLNPGSAHYSATAALDSVKPAEDGYQTGADTILATTCEYGVAHEIQAEGPSYNYTGEGVYNGEYQQGQEYQGNQEQQYDGSPGEQQHDQTYAEQQYDQAYGQQHDQAYDEQQYDQNYNGQQQYDQSGYQDQSQFQTIEGVNQDFAAEYKDYSYQEQDADQKQQVSLAATPAAEASGNAIRSYERTEILADEPTLEQQVYSSETIPTAVANDSAPVIGSQQGSYGYHEGDFQQAEYQQGDYQQGEYQDQSEYQQGYRQGDHQLQDDYQQGNYHQDDYQQGDYQQGDYQQGDYQQGDYQQGDYQQEGYQQEGYQQEGYQQEGYQQEGYQQGDYQQGDYQQGSYQQGGYQQDNNSKNAPPLDETAQPGFSGSNAPSMSEDHKDQVVGQGDQAQQSHFNDNAWWSNGGNGSVDPNGTEEQQVFAANDNSQEPVQESYEEGQFISFGAVPTIPSFGQPAMPVNNSNQHTFDDDDDLGMGNNALNKGKTAATEKTDGTTATQASEDSSTPDNGSNEPKAGWWPKLSLLVGEKRESTPRPVRANLGEESSFYFDKEQQRWVNKKGGAESSSTAEPLPPPAMPRTSSPASGPPNSATGSSAARRGARSKYVDVLNTN